MPGVEQVEFLFGFAEPTDTPHRGFVTLGAVCPTIQAAQKVLFNEYAIAHAPW